MLHHLAGATIQVANLVNYCCNPPEDGNNSSIDAIDDRFYEIQFWVKGFTKYSIG